MIDNFFTHGFVTFEDRSIEKMIPQYDMPQSNSFSMIDVNLNDMSSYVGSSYIAPYFPGYSDYTYSMFVGSEHSTMEWHNDLVEGYNTFFLYYLTTVDHGGELMIQCNDSVVGCVQPKKHLLVMLSQASHVKHRVNPTDQVRVAINLAYKVDGLNY